MKKMILLSIVILTLLITQMSILAQQRLISYQGNITDQQNKPYLGPIQMTIEMYSSETGGLLLWTETQNVSLNNGYFNIYLGSLTPLPIDFNFKSGYGGARRCDCKIASALKRECRDWRYWAKIIEHRRHAAIFLFAFS